MNYNKLELEDHYFGPQRVRIANDGKLLAVIMDEKEVNGVILDFVRNTLADKIGVTLSYNGGETLRLRSRKQYKENFVVVYNVSSRDRLHEIASGVYQVVPV